jgi:hypothetical protein
MEYRAAIFGGVMAGGAKPRGPARAALDAQEAETKNPAPKIARNTLKRLDSDERIQGNPSFSNPQI